jgi:phage baseplate assembly protein gpV
MSDGLLDWANDLFMTEDERIYGVVIGRVEDNLDLTGLGRVQLSLTAIPDLKPWARIAAPFAGSGYGHYSLPQEGDEVLVAFERGDPRHPYVIGSLWSMSSRPPAALPTDATDKRIVKTPKGHVIELDDMLQSVTITTSTGQEIKLSPTAIEISAGNGAAKVTVGTAGSISLEGATKISLSAPAISIDAKADLTLSGAAATLKATGLATIKGTSVAIN